VQAGQLRRTPAALAGDDLVVAGVAGMRAGEQRLEDAAGADGLDEVGEGSRVDGAARLKRAWFDQFDRYGIDTRP
jgi:hypothetical protein